MSMEFGIVDSSPWYTACTRNPSIVFSCITIIEDTLCVFYYSTKFVHFINEMTRNFFVQPCYVVLNIVLSPVEFSHFAIKVCILCVMFLWAWKFFRSTTCCSIYHCMRFVARSTERFRIRRPWCGLWQSVPLIVQFVSRRYCIYCFLFD